MTTPRRVSRILVPIDFSETANATLDYAVFLAKTFGASIELLHVLDPMFNVSAESVLVADPEPETLAEHGRRIAEDELARLAARLEREGIVAKATVETGVPWEIVVRAGLRTDLVVMGTHGRTGLSRVFLGSVTDKVVQRSLTPVLTVRGTVTQAAVAATEPITETS